MRVGRRFFVAIGVAALAATGLAGVPTAEAATGGTEVFYAALATNSTTSDLLLIDADTGALTNTIGPIGFAVTGLAVHPQTGVLYGSTSNRSAANPGSLISIDPSTGVGTLIGKFVGTEETMADIDFGPDGTLYGILEADADDLFTIDLTTGAATLVGDADQSTAGSGLAFDTATGKLLWAGESATGTLFIVDPATGGVTDGPTLAGRDNREISALEFGCDGATLFGVQLEDAGGTSPRPTELVTIDETTGAVVELGSSVEKLDAIAAVCGRTFIDGVYLELLGRQADPGGAAFWSSQISAGASPLSVVKAIESSSEARTAFVTELYQRYLGRAPDAGGLQHFLGVTAAQGPLPARISIIASPEYATNAGGTPNGLVDALYADILGRPASDADRAFWTTALSQSGAGPVIAAVLQSSESATRIVTLTYMRLLGRGPDSAGLAFWRGAVMAGLDEQTVIVEFLGSAEFFGP
jgi:hypothetical protein